MLRKWLDAAIEGQGWFELVLGVLFAIAALLFSHIVQIPISNKGTLYSTLIQVSVQLMAVSAIVVNLAAAIVPATVRIQQAISRIAVATFIPLIALLLSAGLATGLLALDDLLDRRARYVLVGIWVGLVCAASIRSLELGRRILIANLRSRVDG